MSGTKIAPVDVPKKRGEYQVSARVRKALEALASGAAPTQAKACEIAALTPRALSKALRRENVRGFLQDQIREQLGVSAVRASRRMHELLTSPNEMVSYRASAWALACGAGVTPPAAPSTQVNILNAGAAGYLIDLRPFAERGGPIDAADAVHVSSVGGVLLGSKRAEPAMIEGTAVEVAAVDPPA